MSTSNLTFSLFDTQLNTLDLELQQLQEAIAQSRELGKNIILVTFGHMHHALRHTKKRLRTIINQDDQGTIYLNAATTPRIEEKAGDKIHKFSLVNFTQRNIDSIQLTAIDEKMNIESQQLLYSSSQLNLVVSEKSRKIMSQ